MHPLVCPQMHGGITGEEPVVGKTDKMPVVGIRSNNRFFIPGYIGDHLLPVIFSSIKSGWRVLTSHYYDLNSQT